MSSQLLFVLLLLVCFTSLIEAQMYPYGPHYGYGYHNRGYGHGHYHPVGYGYNRGGNGYLAGVFTGMLLRG